MKNIFSILSKVFLTFVIMMFTANAHAYNGGEELGCNTDVLLSETSATFQANWSPVEWTVTYNINGATGTAIADINCQYASTCNAAPQGDLLKTNSTFGGWAMTCSVPGGTCENFTARTISGGESIANITTSDGATITLTAIWNECNACSATNASCSLSVVNNACVYTTECLTGYENIQHNGEYNPSCTAKTIDLTYVDEDGVTPITPETGTCVYDQMFNLPPAPARQGFRFLGWTLVQ